jgi:ribosomal protein S18 acetylase RimI-like enzyme
LSILENIVISEAWSTFEVGEVRQLFLEYAASLEISLCFQDFESEVATLPGKYSPPLGRLLLAREGNASAGCVAVRPLESGICEMKRLFVRPEWRGRGLGRVLATKIITAAREAGYERIRLDTLNTMKSAMELYKSLGFRRIGAYYDNPSEQAVFMELQLRNQTSSATQQWTGQTRS